MPAAGHASFDTIIEAPNQLIDQLSQRPAELGTPAVGAESETVDDVLGFRMFKDRYRGLTWVDYTNLGHFPHC